MPKTYPAYDSNPNSPLFQKKKMENRYRAPSKLKSKIQEREDNFYKNPIRFNPS